MDSTCTVSQKLLYDLSHFIGVILEKEKLSPSAEERRNELRQSLQFFTAPELEVPTEDEYEDPQPIRTCSQLSNYSVSNQSDDASKLYVTFSELKKMSTKFGPLWQKEKGIFREVWRKYLVGLYEQKLVLYCTEKDLKPATCINIQGYVARHAPNIQRDAKKKHITFELICPGKKDYQFFARTAKDMEQWVAIICQTSIQHIDITPCSRPASDHRLVISIDDRNAEETYDDVTSVVVSNGQEESEEEFYDDIVESKHTGTPQANPVQDRKPPTLPIKHKKDNEEAEEKEFYNDVEEYEEPSPKPDAKPVMWHTEHKFDVMHYHSPLPSPTKPNHVEEEEEIYHDIVEYQQSPKPVPVIKLLKDQPPPLPARRPLPSIPKENSEEEEEEIEETYEDINTSIQSHMKQPKQSLQVSGNEINDDDDVEETYDDIVYPPSNHEKHLKLNLSVPESHEDDKEEQEDIYDDVGNSELSSPTKNQFILTNENTNSIINIQNSHCKTGKLANQGKTSELNKEELINITTNVMTKKAEENNQIIIDKKHSVQDTNNNKDKGVNQLILQREHPGQNRNCEKYVNISTTKINNEISKQSTDARGTKKTNTLQNQVSKQNTDVENIKKFTESRNTSFLHKHNFLQDQGNVSSIIQKLQSKNMGSERSFTSPKSNNSSSQINKPNDNTVLSCEYPISEINPEENTTNFLNAFKKIQTSLATGEKPIGGHAIKPDLPTCPNKPLQSSISPTGESHTNSLRNRQNRPLPAKPTTPSTSSKPPEFNSRNKSPNSKAPELPSSSSECASRSSTNSRSGFSSELSANKPNTMSNSSLIEISVSSHQLSPMPPQNRTYLSDKPERRSNKPSMNIKVTVPVTNSSQSSTVSLNRSRNKPNGLPVSIPNVPDSPTSEPPKLPPRSYLKLRNNT